MLFRSYSYTLADTVLDLDPFLSLSEDVKFRDQRVQLLLQVPENGRVYIDPTVKEVLYDVSNLPNIYDHDMVSRTWQMKPEGLDCLDCTGSEDAIGNNEETETDTVVSVIGINEKGVTIKGRNGKTIVIDSLGIKIDGKDGK